MQIDSEAVQGVFGAIISLALAGGAVFATFPLLAALISGAIAVIDKVFLLCQFFVGPVLRRVLTGIQYRAEISLIMQFVVGIGFFYYFIYQVENQHARLSARERTYLFAFLLILVPMSYGVITWKSAHYREHFSRILFYHRFLKPILDWLTFQSYSLQWLQQVPLLQPIIDALEDAANHVRHRRWQIFLRSMFFLSLFTLPVTMLPDGVYHWLGGLAASFPESLGITNATFHIPFLIRIAQSTFFSDPLVILGTIYLYLFDWGATVVFLYIVVSALAPLEPRNLFVGVAEALKYFVRETRSFTYTGFFWQAQLGEHRPVAYFDEREDFAALWTGFALSVHAETGELDKAFGALLQGEINRASIVMENECLPGKVNETAYCVHYRRFSESAFIAAVDMKRERFDGQNTKSQADFLQLSESIGALVDIRHSLRYASIQSVRSVFW